MKANFWKTIAASFGFISFMPCVFAGVVITATNQPLEIPADKAANAFSPAFTELHDIVIAEKNTNDFAKTAALSKSLVLTAPVGWIFKAGCGNVAAMNAGDFSAVSVKISSTTITINFIVKGISNLDVLTISGLQVQPTDGANVNNEGIVYRSVNNPGTAMVNGIIPATAANSSEGTPFATLLQTSGIAAKLAFAVKPVANTAGTLFEQQPVIVTQDQFGNATTRGLDATQNVKIKLSSGTGELIGTKVLNIGTSGGNGLVNFNDLQLNTCGVKRLMVSSGSLSFAITTEMKITEQETNAKISSGDAEDYYPDWMCIAKLRVEAAVI